MKTNLLVILLLFMACNQASVVTISEGNNKTSPPPPIEEYKPSTSIVPSFNMKTELDGIASNDIYDIAVTSKGKIFLATWAGVSISDDGGNTFTTPLRGTTQYIAVLDDLVVAGNNCNGYSLSQDGGKTFTLFDMPTIVHDCHNGIEISKDGTIYIATGQGLAISTDKAASFVTRNTEHGITDTRLLSLALGQDGKIYLGAPDGFAVSTDGGNSFTFTNAITWVSAIAVDSKGKILAFDGGVGALAMSIDNGKNWTPVNQFPEIPADFPWNIKNMWVDEYDVFFIPNGYSREKFGLSFSVDGGENFIHRKAESGLTDPSGLYVESAATYNKTLYLATQAGLAIGKYE